MGTHVDLCNFDLGRIMIVGWQVVLLSLPVGFVLEAIANFCWNGIRPLRTVRPFAIVGFGSAVGFFLAAKALLGMVGLTLIRSKRKKRR